MTDAPLAELVETSRRVLEAELPVMTGLDTQPLIDRWSQLQPHLDKLGWFDLMGELDLSPTVATRLIRLAGYFLVPGPVIDATLTVPWLLSQPGVHAGVLDDPARSVAILDACPDLPGSRSRPAITLRAGRVRGNARCALGAVDADTLLVHALEDEVERLIAIRATQPGVRVEALRGADPCQSVGRVELDCTIDEVHLVTARDSLLPTRLRAWRRLGSAAYLAGMCERVLTFGVDHALVRQQFGRSIGSFQAVQHLLADVAVITRSSANFVDFSAGELAGVDDREATMIGVTTNAYVSRGAVRACETVLQVLGGIGFTAEHPLHHYLKRAVSLAAQDGSPAELDLLAGRLALAELR